MFRSCENFISLAAACEKHSVSAALSLKTSHCDVFLTLAFAPRYLLLDCRMKHGQSKKELSVFLGGDNGARTRDLLTASQALSQLSYTPMLMIELKHAAAFAAALVVEIRGFEPLTS